MGDRFEKVILVGHSYGSYTGWLEAAIYKDVDGLIITGLLHRFGTTFATFIGMHVALYPAMQEARFRHLDPGYLTSRPGTRGDAFYNAENADPKVIELDEKTKETVTDTELTSLATQIAADNATGHSISLDIQVPVFVVVGEKDVVFCGVVSEAIPVIGGSDCSTADTVKKQEAEHYAPEACLETYLLENSGHDVNLHFNSRRWFDAALGWTDKYFAGTRASSTAASTCAES